MQKTDDYLYGDAGWKDLLTSFNGQNISYDEIGNPEIYRDGMSFKWESGRLADVINTPSKEITFRYNSDLLRAKKTITDKATNKSVVHFFDYDGNKLIRDVTGNTALWFVYDESGSPIGFRQQSDNGANVFAYFYVKNLQGDIIAITHASSVVARYTYDSWGNILTVTDGSGRDVSGNPDHIANINPLRYRGYYYDNETGFYYVSSRYYDPEVGRFINEDNPKVLNIDQGSLLQYNLFAYCLNNPINRFDVNGNWSLPNWAKIGIGVAAIAVGVGVTALTGGAALPALAAGVKAACIAGAISAGTRATVTAVKATAAGDGFSTVAKKTMRSAVDGFSDGFMSGGIMTGTSQVLSGGFKIATNFVSNTGKNGGITLGKVKLFSPDASWNINNGGTILKIGEFLRLDVGSHTLFHMHLFNSAAHIPIGIISSGLFGGLKKWE